MKKWFNNFLIILGVLLCSVWLVVSLIRNPLQTLIFFIIGFVLFIVVEILKAIRIKQHKEYGNKKKH